MTSSFQYVIEGQHPLRGEVVIGGSELSAQLLIAASILTSHLVTIKNVPKTRKVDALLECIRFLGIHVETPHTQTVRIHAQNVVTRVVPLELAKQTQASMLLLASIFSRTRRAAVAHVDYFPYEPNELETQLGVLSALSSKPVEKNDDFFTLQGESFGKEHRLEVPSYWATAQGIMLAVLAKGQTVLKNISQDPEIEQLISFLNELGAHIERNENDTLFIEGVNQLQGGEVTVMSDRDEAVFWITAGLLTKGDLSVSPVKNEFLTSFFHKLKQLNVEYRLEGESIHVWQGNTQMPSVEVSIKYHPGFLAQWGVLLTPLLTYADGVSRLVDKTGNYMKLISGLNVYGAETAFDKKEDEHITLVYGPTKLKGNTISVLDNEAVRVFLLAGLAAEGVTTFHSPISLDGIFDHCLEKCEKVGGHIRFLN